VLAFDAVPAQGESRQVRLAPGPARHQADSASFLYRLHLRSPRGEQPAWRESSQRRFFLGASLTYLGRAETLERDLYAVDWGECGIPSVVAPREEFLVLAHLTNASAHPWPSRGAARVRLSYLWHGPGSDEPERNGLRTDLGADIQPGESLTTWLRVQAPALSGPYRLQLDLIYEGVSWFSLVNGGKACEAKVEVRSSV
jgi:hypothetical protein